MPLKPTMDYEASRKGRLFGVIYPLTSRYDVTPDVGG
jgi:hypothetical protein